MNGCWEEARIEAAALRWVARRAIGAGDDSEETGRLLDHARMCVRCRELFELFVETEWRAAAIGAETLRDEARTYRLIDLIELPEEAALGAGGGEWGSPSFSLAARDPGSSYGAADVTQSPRALASATG
ncbi:MAG: hypothetical protein EHM19_04835 [Candidatus Latescibacterota bacterium]|nr:MAG: hypothetical protein EHM19_04835 [Candidatus Latescibacterota bacterium]